MSINELCTKGAAELAAMIRDRKVTSSDVVDACLARIREVNPALNAVTVALADQARAAAAAVDKAVAAGQRLGPLAGVPFTIKENVDGHRPSLPPQPSHRKAGEPAAGRRTPST